MSQNPHMLNPNHRPTQSVLPAGASVTNGVLLIRPQQGQVLNLVECFRAEARAIVIARWREAAPNVRHDELIQRLNRMTDDAIYGLAYNRPVQPVVVEQSAAAPAAGPPFVTG